MLSNETINQALELATLVADNGVTLAPIKDTPLHVLVKETIPAEEILLSKSPEAVELDIASYVANISTHVDGANICNHDLVLEEMKSVLATAVSTALNIARVDVNSMVKRVTEKLKTQLEDYIADLNNPLSIVPLYNSVLWGDGPLASMVEKYATSPVEDVRVSNIVSDIATVDHVKTGIVTLDESVEAMLRSRPNLLNTTMQKIFSSDGETDQLIDVIRYKLDDNELVIGFLLARRFLEETPSTTGCDLSTFNSWCTSIKVMLGAAIFKGMERQRSRSKSDELVINYPYGVNESNFVKERYREELVINVNGELYGKWLKEGGSPEVIFGALFSDKATKSKVLLEKSHSYIRTWSNLVRIASIAKTNQSFVRMQHLLGQILTKEIQEMEDEDLVDITREGMFARLKEHIDHMCADDLENLYYTVRHVICNVFFPHTHAYRILTEMDAVMRRENVKDPREAALFTAINYTTDWVADQIEKHTTN